MSIRTWAGAVALLAGLAIPLTVGIPSQFANADDVVTAKSSIADVVERVMPGVVNISSTRKAPEAQSPLFQHPFFRDFFGDQPPPDRLQRGLGSGVIVNADGTILTSNHVVAKADDIRVTLPGSRREFVAKVVGADPKSDLAVLKLQNTNGVKLNPLKFGDSGSLRLGETVLAIGNPFGVGQTVTAGIVSAKGRANVGIVEYEDFIQTDAAINPGNSGGALVNEQGDLVGINTAIISRSGGYQGIGFAIPANMARPIMDSLLKHGRVMRGWLGVVIQDIDEDLAKALKVPTTQGVLVSDIDPQGPAAKAGIQRGDLITEINGRTVDESAQLRNIIAGIGAKGKANVTFIRKGQKQTREIMLSELPARFGGGEGDGERSESENPSLGMRLAPLNERWRQELDLPRKLDHGLVVQELTPDGAAAEAGIRPGDVLLEANQVKLNSASRFSEVYAAADSQVLLLVLREGSTLFLLLPK